ncbi:MAG: cellulose biosynthesis protein BcsS [Methyloligellaceae bacterium]
MLTPDKASSFDPEILKGRVDYTSGVDISEYSYSAYGGISIAPMGLITEPGLRIKLNIGAGQYHYDGTKNDGMATTSQMFTGRTTTIDLLAGYSFKKYDWITKAYIGVQYNNHSVTPDDPENPVQGTAANLKIQLETWKDLGNKTSFSSHVSYTSNHADYWFQSRLFTEYSRRFTLGLEGAVFGNENYSATRFGALGRMKTDFGDVTLSGGISASNDEDMSPYLSLSIYQKF